MSRLLAIFIGFISTGSFAGDEITTDPVKYKDAEKAIAFMAKIGVHNDTMKEIAYLIDERVDDGAIRFGEAKLGATSIRLQYELSRPSIENAQLKFRNDDLPNWEINGNPRGILINYSLEF